MTTVGRRRTDADLVDVEHIVVVVDSFLVVAITSTWQRSLRRVDRLSSVPQLISGLLKCVLHDASLASATSRHNGLMKWELTAESAYCSSSHLAILGRFVRSSSTVELVRKIDSFLSMNASETVTVQPLLNSATKDLFLQDAVVQP